MIDSLPDLTCYGNMQTLALQSNPLRGTLPAGLWHRLPDIQNLLLANTLLNGLSQLSALRRATAVRYTTPQVSAMLTPSCSVSLTGRHHPGS